MGKYAQMDDQGNESGVGDGSKPSSCWARYTVVKDTVRVTLDDPESGPVASFVHYGVIVLIAASTMLAILTTIEDFTERFPTELEILEMAFTGLFTAEILTRIWTSPSCCDYFMHVSNLVDILATMPWYLEQYVARLGPGKSKTQNMDKIAGSMRTLRMVRLVRMVRLLRVLRLAKAARHSETISTVLESIVDSIEGIMVLVFFVAMGSVLPATLVYAIESEEEGSKFASIPASMWWSMATITTVGYGDVVPSTIPGKAIACGTMVVGMIIVSVSVAAITTSFTESYNRRMALVKMAKNIKKARASVASIQDEASPSCRAEPSMPSIPGSSSFRSMDREKMDLMTTFAFLEEDVKSAMARLEQAIHEAAINAEAPSGQRTSMSTRGSFCIPQKNDYSLLALQVLHDQSVTFIKGAHSLVEQLNDAEAQRRATLPRRASIATMASDSSHGAPPASTPGP